MEEQKKVTGKKAWAGRFTEPENPLVEEFNASIRFDKRLYRQDIAGSIAHVSMLGRQKIIPGKDSKKIVSALRKIEKEISSGKSCFSDSDEDIHMAIERRLVEIVGREVGGKLHTARSRNDQVATSFRMYVRDQTDRIIRLLRELRKVLYQRACSTVDTIAPAYTHLQPAQPVRLAHWFLAYYEMFGRDEARLISARGRTNVLPLGSAALAGTNFPIDRQWVRKQLGFEALSENSIDAVSDRDFVAEFLFATALTATHLSRLAEELVIFTSAEFNVMELPDAFCTGSSIMPQKKNPDVPELIRGKTGRLTGSLVAVMTMLKGLPLAYNKDMQEDKEPVFDSVDQLTSMLTLTAQMVGLLKINEDKLAKRAEEGFMTAVDLADRLVMAGVAFREAHEIVGKLVRYCLDNGVAGFHDLSGSDMEKVDPRLASALKGRLTPAKSTDGKNSYGGTARRRVLARLKAIDKEISKW